MATTSKGLLELLERHNVTPTGEQIKDIELARQFMPEKYTKKSSELTELKPKKDQFDRRNRIMSHNEVIAITMFIEALSVERTLIIESHYIGDDEPRTTARPESSAELVIDTVMDGERSVIDILTDDEFAELECRVDDILRGDV